jgi:hypothetical protein
MKDSTIEDKVNSIKRKSLDNNNNIKIIIKYINIRLSKLNKEIEDQDDTDEERVVRARRMELNDLKLKIMNTNFNKYNL